MNISQSWTKAIHAWKSFHIIILIPYIRKGPVLSLCAGTLKAVLFSLLFKLETFITVIGLPNGHFSPFKYFFMRFDPFSVTWFRKNQLFFFLLFKTVNCDVIYYDLYTYYLQKYIFILDFKSKTQIFPYAVS